MNPRLLKFMIELQTPEQKEEETKYINFTNNGSGGKKIFEVSKLAKVTIPVTKN